MMKKNNNPFTNSILESVYNYYTNEKNYLTESLEEESGAIMLDDSLFNDIMDSIYSGNFDEDTPGHYLIPTKNNSTFHITMNGDAYIDDELGNENEISATDDQIHEILNSVRPTEYKNVSENKNEDSKGNTVFPVANGKGYRNPDTIR